MYFFSRSLMLLLHQTMKCSWCMIQELGGYLLSSSYMWGNFLCTVWLFLIDCVTLTVVIWACLTQWWWHISMIAWLGHKSLTLFSGMTEPKSLCIGTEIVMRISSHWIIVLAELITIGKQSQIRMYGLLGHKMGFVANFLWDVVDCLISWWL
jgi:hypothetical protein